MKVLVFVGLKIAEIVGIGFLPYWVGKLVCLHPEFKKVLRAEPPVPYWCIGLIALAIPAVIICILMINWDWAGEIIKGGL